MTPLLLCLCGFVLSASSVVYGCWRLTCYSTAWSLAFLVGMPFGIAETNEKYLTNVELVLIRVCFALGVFAVLVGLTLLVAR